MPREASTQGAVPGRATLPRARRPPRPRHQPLPPRRPAGLGFPHVFPIMWNGLKTAVAGPYLGVATTVHGVCRFLRSSSLRGRLLGGRVPVVLTFVPTHSSSRGLLGCAPPARGLTDPGRWLVGVSRPRGFAARGGQALPGRVPGPPPRPFQMRPPSAGGSDFVIYGSACPTLPRSSFNRCSHGRETKRRRRCGRRGRRRGTEASLSGLTGRLTTGRRLKAAHIHPSVRGD